MDVGAKSEEILTKGSEISHLNNIMSTTVNCLVYRELELATKINSHMYYGLPCYHLNVISPLYLCVHCIVLKDLF